MAKKSRKTAPGKKASSASSKRPSRRRQTQTQSQPQTQTRTRPPPPPLPYDQQLSQAARSLAVPIWQVLNGIILATAFVGLLLGLWLLRPTPTFSSEEVTAGSPFDVRFRVENDSGFATLANLRISCVLASLRGSGLSDTMVAATNPSTSQLAPGESATFTCPFHAGIPQVRRNDPGAAQRAEIYFHSEYDLPPLPSWFPVTDNSTKFILNTQILPPRWTAKPAK
ncbi:MAG: hypothetical protein U1E60_21280 [Reyranellaceae bacterium]